MRRLLVRCGTQIRAVRVVGLRFAFHLAILGTYMKKTLLAVALLAGFAGAAQAPTP